MSFPLRRRKRSDLPGSTLVVRNHRSLATLLDRIEPGDLVVLDQLDLGADTARALVDRRPGAVLNAAAFISGRFANRGPLVLADAGVPLFEGPRDAVLALRDGARLRLHDDTLHDGAVVVLDLDAVSPEQVRDRMAAAQSGLAVQLESFAHAASELVRREEELLLHGRGLPTLRTAMTDRVVLVIGPAAQHQELRSLRRFARGIRPVVIAVDSALGLPLSRALRPDLAVLSGADLVSDKAVRRARELVLAGGDPAVHAQAERLNLPSAVVGTGIAPVDVALLLARAGGARLVVPVGAPATLDELIDRDRADQASNVLTRLRLGSGVVDGRAVPVVRRRPRRWRPVAAIVVAMAVVAGFLALAPGGQDALDEVRGRLPEGWGNPAALDRAEARVQTRDARLDALTDEVRSAEAFAAATAPAIVRGRLTDRAVTLLVLPGADPGTVAALPALVAAAGAQVTGTVTVLPAAVAPEQRGLVDALSSQLVAQTPDLQLGTDASGYERLGALLARAAGLPAGARLVRGTYDAQSVSIVSGLGTAKLTTARVTARAALTIVVTGAAARTDDLLVPVVTAYGSQVPTVVVGPSRGGVVGALREADVPFSTVSGAGAEPGRVVGVLALAARTRGTVGAYDPDGDLPPLS